MNTLIYLIPIALFLGCLGLGAFLWSIRSGQYEDLDGAAWRVLDDGEAGNDAGGGVRGGAKRG
ncbi:cbb3-type cytochrome oxidase maturation protein [Rhizobium subbaraonis]|uniref:Cbb3-type cytochrome oxidase maturation protein n=1 Tax=Rhizobium subbaraonis TaxID=908946 RepID=A0A285ULK7_9HYPH|nr:cbb3-type cytochrome oxidase assembly protein CcoS [Rhizobium subbaraonis]SOC42804.1 cbb3-type cytochrome oxidase maturation protein [Rhizobium subbaraonis]